MMDIWIVCHCSSPEKQTFIWYFCNDRQGHGAPCPHIWYCHPIPTTPRHRMHAVFYPSRTMPPENITDNIKCKQYPITNRDDAHILSNRCFLKYSHEQEKARCKDTVRRVPTIQYRQVRRDCKRSMRHIENLLYCGSQSHPCR